MLLRAESHHPAANPTSRPVRIRARPEATSGLDSRWELGGNDEEVERNLVEGISDLKDGRSGVPGGHGCGASLGRRPEVGVED